jgi:predicted HAD superfamily Cof-like phosphohydrolase
MIIIEGPDASGKSTLAQYIAQALNAPVQPSEGPPRFPGDIAQRVKQYALLPPHTVFDRHPIISEEMYAYALRRPLDLPSTLVKQFYEAHHTIIYCDPPSDTNLPHHQIKDHDSPEHVMAIADNYARLVEAYRSWAISHARFIYRIGDDKQSFVHYLTDFVQDIHNFHHRFEITYQGPPRPLPRDLKHFRTKFMLEELCEYAGVSPLTTKLIESAFYEHAVERPLDEQFDALIDIIYVALGTAHLQGFPFHEGWALVHRANMLKRRVASPQESKRGHAFDVVKPADWRPPDLRGLVHGNSVAPCLP